MKTIYAKYNRNRQPKYQLKTTILITDSGNIIVEKKTLSAEGKTHITNILKNYKDLKAKYPKVKYTPATLIADDTVVFNYVTGKSLDSHIWEAIKKRNATLILETIGIYINFLKTFELIEVEEFKADSTFIQVFDCDIKFNKILCMTEANIDLIFDNIFIHDSELTIIDYEWIFDTLIPLDYIIFRSINRMFWKYGEYLNGLLDIKDIFEYLGIRETENYQVMENGFQRYVLGRERNFGIGQEYSKDKVVLPELNNQIMVYQRKTIEQANIITRNEQEMQNLKEQCHTLTNETNNLKKALEKEKLENGKLSTNQLVINEQLNKIKIYLKNCQQECDVLREMNEDLQLQFSQRIDDLTIMNQTIKAKIYRVFGITPYKKQKNALIIDNLNSVSSQKGKILESKTSQLIELDQYLSSLEQTMAKLSERNDELRLEVNHLNVVFKDLTEQYHEKSHLYESLKHEHHHVILKHNELYQSFETLQKQYHQLKYDFEQNRLQLFRSLSGKEDNS